MNTFWKAKSFLHVFFDHNCRTAPAFCSQAYSTRCTELKFMMPKRPEHTGLAQLQNVVGNYVSCQFVWMTNRPRSCSFVLVASASWNKSLAFCRAFCLASEQGHARNVWHNLRQSAKTKLFRHTRYSLSQTVVLRRSCCIRHVEHSAMLVQISISRTPYRFTEFVSINIAASVLELLPWASDHE